MANVKVKLFANLKELAETSEIIISGQSVLEVLHVLIVQYPNLQNLIFEKTDSNQLCGYINIFLNGENIDHMEGLETQLQDDDEIGVLPPVSGG